MKDAFSPNAAPRPDLPPQAALRDPDRVMRLRQFGAMFPTRLSFLRILLRRLAAEGARVARPVWEIDAQGYGHAVYSVPLGGHVYSLVAVASPLPDDMRTDRVIATAWDAAFVLYDGVPDAAEIARIVETAPRQEAGRFTARDLVLSRANKSVRLWAEIVGALRAGRQPDPARLTAVGYLMRTTAVYGNGKFGIADRARIAERPGLDGPFAAEMLTVWLIRAFTLDLVEHVAGAPLDRALKRHLGIGNATGLGMAPFLVSHPVLLNNWMAVRETAFARVRGLETVTAAQADALRALAGRARAHLAEWHLPDPREAAALVALRADFAAFTADAALWSCAALQERGAMDRLARAAAALGPEVEELTLALLIEPFGDLVDGLACCLADPGGPPPEPPPDTAALRALIETHCAWALAVDHARPENCARFWYVSEEKLEPRLGRRFEEPGAERETPLDIARRIAALHADLPADPAGEAQPLAAFLAAHPDHLLAIDRVALAARHPYAEIRDSLIAEACRPVDLLRAKLAMFGAARFDPKSDLWTRITLCQGAPLADELTPRAAEAWWLATAPRSQACAQA